MLRTFTDKEQLRTCKGRYLILINFGLFFCWCAEFEDKLIARRARRGTTSTNEAGIFFLPLRKFPRIQLNYHLGCNQNLELCSSTVLCSAERSRYDGSTLNPRYQVRTCTAHYSVLNFRWQFCVQPKITLGQDKCEKYEKCETLTQLHFLPGINCSC